MPNENENGAMSHREQGPEDTAGAPLHPSAMPTEAPTALVGASGDGILPSEIFSRLKEHPGLIDVMTRAMNGEAVNPQEVHAALTQAGVSAPGAVARVPRRPLIAERPTEPEPRRRPVVTPTPPDQRQGARQPPRAVAPPPPEPELTDAEVIEEMLRDVPLDYLLSMAGQRLWNALGQMMPGCHLSITLAEEGVHAVILLPPDPEVEEDEAFALANVQGEPDQLGEVCSMAFEVADSALTKIRAEGLG